MAPDRPLLGPAVVLVLAGLAFSAAACTNGVVQHAVPTTAPSTAASSPVRCPDGGAVTGLEPNEVGADGNGVTLFGLVLAKLPIRSGEDVKIVWRMTGRGDATFTAFDPQGTAQPLAWGPEFHGGQGASTYHRPGAEWGVGYKFPTAGCWRLHAKRTVGSADVWLAVRP